jgi:hypothetical protein
MVQRVASYKHQVSEPSYEAAPILPFKGQGQPVSDQLLKPCALNSDRGSIIDLGGKLLADILDPSSQRNLPR